MDGMQARRKERRSTESKCCFCMLYASKLAIISKSRQLYKR
ncbi:uncharacterized protein RAG0_14046 [Rhynchosporium agropyri]|nr:uncharacterized protein RAG0_14046 [Rhynchosporium agropyri]CZT10483.1 uncharacterized protein RCO7_15074 [Rhynchosporium commune]